MNSKMTTKLAVLDFDSTLYPGETLDDICRHFLTKQQFEDVLKRAADAREIIDNNTFYYTLNDRVSMLKGIPYSKVKEYCEANTRTYFPGAKALVDGLHERGYRVVIFSGGFRTATSLAKQELGIDEDFANTFLVDADGNLTGEASGPMMLLSSKGELIQQIQHTTGITPENTLVVGDSTNDISMFKYAKHSVAFCAKQIVREQATIAIDEPDLSMILKHI